MNRRNLLGGSFLTFTVLAQGAVLAASCSRQTSSVTVIAHGPRGMRIEGRGRVVSVEDDSSALSFKVPIAPLGTGMGLRDAHLRRLLEEEKYPVATLRVPRSGLRFPGAQEPAEGMVEGELTLHGRSRPVTVRYRAERDGGAVIRLRGSFHLDMRDFDIPAPSLMDVPASPLVEVRAELSVKGLDARPGVLVGSSRTTR